MDEWHHCHFCGDYVRDGKGTEGQPHKLVDCRPDLVKHDPGPLCTWYGFGKPVHRDCYAYQDDKGNWTELHEHFYPEESYT